MAFQPELDRGIPEVRRRASRRRRVAAAAGIGFLVTSAVGLAIIAPVVGTPPGVEAPPVTYSSGPYLEPIESPEPLEPAPVPAEAVAPPVELDIDVHTPRTSRAPAMTRKSGRPAVAPRASTRPRTAR